MTLTKIVNHWFAVAALALAGCGEASYPTVNQAGCKQGRVLVEGECVEQVDVENESVPDGTTSTPPIETPSAEPLIDLCDGVDNDNNGIVDEWGCGKFIYAKWALDNPSLDLLDLQTLVSSTFFSSEITFNYMFHLSPDRQQVAKYFHSPSQRIDGSLKIIDLQGNVVREISFSEERQDLSSPSGHIFGFDWVDNTNIVLRATCFPCGFTRDSTPTNRSPEGKIFVSEGLNNYRMLRPDVPTNDHFIASCGNTILGKEINADYDFETTRYFVYDLSTDTTSYLNPNDSLPILSTYNGVVTSSDCSTFYYSGTFSELYIDRNPPPDSDRKVYAYNLNLQAVTVLDSGLLRGLYVHPSGRDRLLYHSYSSSEYYSTCSMFTDGSGKVCFDEDSINDFPYMQYLEHLPSQ